MNITIFFQCLECVGGQLGDAVLGESVQTLRFVYELAEFRKDWFLHLPLSMQLIMVSIWELTGVGEVSLLGGRFWRPKFSMISWGRNYCDVRGLV